MIYGHLPTWEHALSICEVYLDNAAWLFRGVSRRQLMDEMLPAIYKRKVTQPDEDDYGGPHHLALMMSIFAVGRIVDIGLTIATSEAEGEHYNQLAKAALCLQPVMEKPSLITIQALHMLSIYNAMSGSEVSGGESSMETTWSLIGLAAHLSQTVSFPLIPVLCADKLKVNHRSDSVKIFPSRLAYLIARLTMHRQIEIVHVGNRPQRSSSYGEHYSGIFLSLMPGMYVFLAGFP